MKGRGAEFNLSNPYIKNEYATDHIEGLDEEFYPEEIKTEFLIETPKNILSKNDSPDIQFTYSINPYQGCEHGCVYCYARNSHLYWGLGAGLDFESKIIVKKNAAQLLEKSFLKRSWVPQTVALSGNTDCYQPAERKFKITRSLLKVFLKYGNPVGIITKNVLVLRDIDILSELSKERLVKIFFSITSLEEETRRILEPRTASAAKKLKVIEKLVEKDIPVGVMMGPIIPGINDMEIDSILGAAAKAGASDASYTVVRLNGQLSVFFEKWLEKHLPDRKEKVLNKIKSLHGDALNDTQWKRRMRGDGELSKVIAQLFNAARKKHFKEKRDLSLNTSAFRKNGNLNLF